MYVAWSGYFTTYGEPNPKTGKFSKSGRLFFFKTQEDRDAFCNIIDLDTQANPVPTDKKDAYQYFAGVSENEYQAIFDIFAAKVKDIIENNPDSISDNGMVLMLEK